MMFTVFVASDSYVDCGSEKMIMVYSRNAFIFLSRVVLFQLIVLIILSIYQNSPSLIHTQAHMRARAHTHIHTHTYTQPHAHTDARFYICIHVPIRPTYFEMHIHLPTFIFLHTCTCIHTKGGAHVGPV